jgi:hypothetical protein
LADEHRVTEAFDTPARNWIECWSAQRFTSPEIEASVMQRASQLAADSEPFDERASVMRTACTDCEIFLAVARQNHIFAIDLP